MNFAFPVEAIRPPNHTHTPGRRRFGQERRPPREENTPRRGHTPLPALPNVPLQTHTSASSSNYPIQTVQILFPVVWMS